MIGIMVVAGAVAVLVLLILLLTPEWDAPVSRCPDCGGERIVWTHDGVSCCADCGAWWPV